MGRVRVSGSSLAAVRPLLLLLFGYCCHRSIPPAHNRWSSAIGQAAIKSPVYLHPLSVSASNLGKGFGLLAGCCYPAAPYSSALYSILYGPSGHRNGAWSPLMIVGMVVLLISFKSPRWHATPPCLVRDTIVRCHQAKPKRPPAKASHRSLSLSL